jgi:transposase
MICVVRMGSDKRTGKYVARRTAEGKSKWEIMRCLKRYIARELYRMLLSSTATKRPSVQAVSRVLEADIA